MRTTITILALLLACSPAAHAGPLKVFLLVGQSNMEGHAHVRTLGHASQDPDIAAMLRQIQNAEGALQACDDVWISYLSTGGEKRGRLTAGFGASDEKIGPELTFGIRARTLLKEPILLIKTAWGGKSLHTDFRPPSAGAYEFNETQLETFKKQGKDVAILRAAKEQATGHYYRLMLAHAKKVLANIKDVYPAYDAEAGFQLAGFVWFQGWNDMVDRGVYPDRDRKGGYGDYSTLLAQFIRDVRRDLDAPKLPFVIGVMGVNGPTARYLPDQRRYAGVHQNFRDAMAAPATLPEFQGNVATVLTETFWDPELTRLRAREAQLRQVQKQRQQKDRLNREQARALLEELRAKEFSAGELRTLDTGVSNAEYHYLGSARIMAGIGKGFAEAAVALLGKR